MADDHEDTDYYGSNEDVFTASELYEMDRDTEYRLDAADDARNTEATDAAEAENR
jgi:hypothetical protein